MSHHARVQSGRKRPPPGGAPCHPSGCGRSTSRIRGRPRRRRGSGGQSLHILVRRRDAAPDVCRARPILSARICRFRRHQESFQTRCPSPCGCRARAPRCRGYLSEKPRTCPALGDRIVMAGGPFAGVRREDEGRMVGAGSPATTAAGSGPGDRSTGGRKDDSPPPERGERGEGAGPGGRHRDWERPVSGGSGASWGKSPPTGAPRGRIGCQRIFLARISGDARRSLEKAPGNDRAGVRRSLPADRRPALSRP